MLMLDTLDDISPADMLPASTPQSPGLRTHGLTLDVSGTRLLDRIDLSLPGDGISLVMGANGAGKSLLLRLLHGLLPATAGRISWNGKPLTKALCRRQAMVFQAPALLRRSVAANIIFALRHRGLDRPGRCEELLAMAGLQDKAGQPARLLSGGEQQRLAMVRALAQAPEILFLDEPTASLDPAATLAIEDLTHLVAAGGTKIVMVSHDIGQARRLADDVAFLHAGRLAEHTAAHQFFKAPHSRPARDYLKGRVHLSAV